MGAGCEGSIRFQYGTDVRRLASDGRVGKSRNSQPAPRVVQNPGDCNLSQTVTESPYIPSLVSHQPRKNKMYTTSSRRNSHSQHTSRHRPRLLRSSATQASVTASNEIQASLVSPNSPHTATDLLNKVAYMPPSSCDLGQPMASEPTSHRTPEPIEIERESRDQSSSTGFSTPDNSISGSQQLHNAVLPDTPRQTWHVYLAGCYFSFPNFDNWESPKEEGEKENYPWSLSEICTTGPDRSNLLSGEIRIPGVGQTTEPGQSIHSPELECHSTRS